jgi:hypothetical protein
MTPEKFIRKWLGCNYQYCDANKNLMRDDLYKVINADYLQKRINVCESSILGALDGLEMDNTCDVIEKHLVIEQLNDLLNILTK